MSINIIARAGNYIEKHRHKGLLSYVIYLFVFLFLAAAVIMKVIFNFLFVNKLRHN
jgi:hypothetical protein